MKLHAMFGRVLTWVAKYLSENEVEDDLKELIIEKFEKLQEVDILPHVVVELAKEVDLPLEKIKAVLIEYILSVADEMEEQT